MLKAGWAPTFRRCWGPTAWRCITGAEGRLETMGVLTLHHHEGGKHSAFCWCSAKVTHTQTVSELLLLLERKKEVVEDEDFTKVIKVKWGHKGGIVVPRDYCPFKKSPERAGFSCIQRGCVCMMRWKSPASQGMRTQNETCLAGKILILDSPALRTVRKNFQFFKPLCLWHFIMADHANEYSNLSECAVYKEEKMPLVLVARKIRVSVLSAWLLCCEFQVSFLASKFVFCNS